LGNDEKTTVSKLMTKLMTNSLAVHFNFDGHNPQNASKIKRSFKQLKLWELIQGICLHSDILFLQVFGFYYVLDSVK
jgi:hypothetical protein